MPSNQNTAAFTYYYDPVILRNKLTPLSIFERFSSEKVRFKIVYGLLLNRWSIGCKHSKMIWIGIISIFGFSGR